MSGSDKHRGLYLTTHLLSPLAVSTRFELATSAVTGRRSNQLRYETVEKVANFVVLRVQGYGQFFIPPNFFAKIFKKIGLNMSGGMAGGGIEQQLKQVRYKL